MRKKEKFPSLLPIAMKVAASTIGDKIDSEIPRSPEYYAKGRPMRPSPIKYDTFLSIEQMEDYIKDQFMFDKLFSKLEPSWLILNENVRFMNFQLRKDVYYTGGNLIAIECTEPAEYTLQCIRMGGSMVTLKPGEWDIEELRKMVERLKMWKR